MNILSPPPSTAPDPLFLPVEDVDPATPGDPTSRLRYQDGQLLNAEDFATEQRYLVLRSRLHNALLHGVGTVWGLEIRSQQTTRLTGEPSSLQLVCDPGLAIDPLGREIWVLEPLCLDLSGLPLAFWQRLKPVEALNGVLTTQPQLMYVVLRYQACLRDPVPAIQAPCIESGDSQVYSRIVDSFRLCLEAEPPPDPAPTVRDISRRPVRGLRELWLDHALNRPEIKGLAPLQRFWSGSDEAPLLLATVEITPEGDAADGIQPIKSVSVDNGVRAVLPAVQALADLAFGLQLDGDPALAGPGPFQAIGVTLAVDSAASPATTILTVTTTQALDDEVLGSAMPPPSVQVLWRDTIATSPEWKEATVNAAEALGASGDGQPPGLKLTVEGTWAKGTRFQVLLAGSGPQALLSKDGHLLAGVVGDRVPSGCGRDACLGGITP